jgi:hypothetical protein
LYNQEEEMRIFLALVLTVAITAPAAAQYGFTPSVGSASVTRHSAPAAQKAKSNKAKATRSYAQEYRGSPYSSNPEFDVYVNGDYVGSDPDPRIRATLAHEWRNRGGFR